MSRVHDMGGRFGDGAINPNEPDAVFPQDWHGRALALTLAAGGLGQWNLDISRHARECLSPQDYARFGYYEKWIAGLTDLLVDNGVVTQEELSTLTPAPNSPLQDRKMLAEYVAKILASGGPADRPSDIPALFTIGQRVKTRVHWQHLGRWRAHPPAQLCPWENGMDHCASRHTCFPRQQCTSFGRSP